MIQCKLCDIKFYSRFTYYRHLEIHQKAARDTEKMIETIGYDINNRKLVQNGHERPAVASIIYSNNNSNNAKADDGTTVADKHASPAMTSETGGLVTLSNTPVVQGSKPAIPGLAILAEKVASASIERQLRRRKTRLVIRRIIPATKIQQKLPDVANVSCRFCGTKLQSHLKLLGHFARFHFANLYAASGWKCAFCDVSTGSEKMLLRHLVAEHNVLGHTIKASPRHKLKKTPAHNIALIDLSLDPEVPQQVPDKTESSQVVPEVNQANLCKLPIEEEITFSL